MGRPSINEIKEAVAPKKPNGSIDLKKLGTRWTLFMALCGGIATVWTAFSYVHDKLEKIEQSVSGIEQLKERLDEHSKQMERLRNAVNERTQATQNAFSQAQLRDVELSHRIHAVLTEVRVRHGADLPPAPPEVPTEVNIPASMIMGNPSAGASSMYFRASPVSRRSSGVVSEAAEESDIAASAPLLEDDPLAGIPDL